MTVRSANNSRAHKCPVQHEQDDTKSIISLSAFSTVIYINQHFNLSRPNLRRTKVADELYS